MPPTTTEPTHHTATGELDELIASWRRHLIAQRMSPATVSKLHQVDAQLSWFFAALAPVRRRDPTAIVASLDWPSRVAA